MRQKLAWTDGDSLWRMTFPTRRYSFGGIQLQRAVNIEADQSTARLAFHIRPAHMAAYLSVALVDHPSNQTTRAMTDCPLRAAGSFGGDGWALVEIPLRKFPSDGMLIAEGTEGPIEVVDTPGRSFDWAAIKEIRFLNEGGEIPVQEVVIKNIRFVR